MKRFLLRWLLNTAGLWVMIGILQLTPWAGVKPVSIIHAFLAILVLSLLNAFIRPVLKLFAMPLNCLTLGLVGIVINVFLFWLAFRVTPGFEVEGSMRGVVSIIILYVGVTIINAVASHATRKGD
jgi:putative membrane protein